MFLTDYSTNFDLNALFTLAILSQPKYLNRIVSEDPMTNGQLNIKTFLNAGPEGKPWLGDDQMASVQYGYRAALKEALEDSAYSMILAIQAAQDYYYAHTNNVDLEDPQVIADIATFNALLTFARATNNWIPLLIEIDAIDGTPGEYSPEFQTMMSTGD